MDSSEGLSRSGVIERGRLAREILDNPIFESIFDELKQDLFNAWMVAGDVQTASKLFELAQSMTLFQAKLMRLVNEAAYEQYMEKQEQLTSEQQAIV